MRARTDSWLARVIAQAVDENWCTKTVCTTCGANDFRRALWAEAAAQCGRSFALQRGAWPSQELLNLPEGERQALINAFVAGLVGLPRNFRHDAEVRTAIDELGRVVPFWSIAQTLGESEAGEVLRRQRQYEADRARERRERAESAERRQLEEVARREAKREANRRMHAENKAKKDVRRAKVVAEHSRLPTSQLLTRLAREKHLPLDAVPPTMINVEEISDGALDWSAAASLVERIDARPGRWREIRRRLEERLSADPREGDRRTVDKRLEYFNGEEWMDAMEAIAELGIDFEDVAEPVESFRAGGGAYGSPAEYSIYWRIWRVGNRWIVDQKDEGMGYHVFDSEKAARADMDRRLEELEAEGGDPYE